MRFSRLKLTNWRNFADCDVKLSNRMFILGANASGKSNLLDAFRFLHDLSVSGGGLEQAVASRRGITRLRSLHATSRKGLAIEVDLTSDEEKTKWTYRLAFDRKAKSASRSNRSFELPLITEEMVIREENGKAKQIIKRPEAADATDPLRLSQTVIEQRSSNKDFREIVDFFASIEYTNLVPQLVRHGFGAIEQTGSIGFDPLGRDFLVRMRQTTEKARNGRLKRISKQLTKLVPGFEELGFETDESGKPHLTAKFKHWREQLANQRETEFSDGTLRLISMFWLMGERSSGPLLLDEPEWSLHSEIVTKMAESFSAVQRSSTSPRQLFVATHSKDLVTVKSIRPEEVIVLRAKDERATEVKLASEIPSILSDLQLGLTVADTCIPRTAPKLNGQLSLFTQ